MNHPKNMTFELRKRIALAILLVPLLGCSSSVEGTASLIDRARILNDGERFGESLEILSQVQQREPANEDVHYLSGIAYEQLGELEKAVASYSACISLSGTNSDALNNRAVVYARLDKLGLAVADLQSAVEINPDDALAWANLGVAYHQQGDFERAEQSFLASNDRVKSSDTLLQLGNARLQGANVTGAISAYTQALAFDEEFIEAYLYRSLAKHESGDTTGAVTDLQAIAEAGTDIAVDVLADRLQGLLAPKDDEKNARELVAKWLELQGWETQFSKTSSIGFTATRLPQFEQSPVDSRFASRFRAVALPGDKGTSAVFCRHAELAKLSKAESSDTSAARLPIYLFAVDLHESGRNTDNQSSLPAWLFDVQTDWMPSQADATPDKMRIQLGRNALLGHAE